MIVLTHVSGRLMALNEKRIDFVWPEDDGCALQVTGSDHQFLSRQSFDEVLAAIAAATGQPNTWARGTPLPPARAEREKENKS